MNHCTHAITELWLENFRSYHSLRLQLAPQSVVLTGANGAGKTNILEAISLFAPGRGFRGAALSEMDKISDVSPLPFTVSLKIDQPDASLHMGTARDVSAARDVRIIKMNGKKVAKQAALTQATCLLWLTPAMDQLFLSGQSARRKWIDRLVFAFDPQHAARVSAYEHAMRERTRLFKRYQTPDAQWLDILERDMAAHGVAMIAARLAALQRIHEAMDTMPNVFPKAALAIHGDTEMLLLRGASALEAEEAMMQALAHHRSIDARAGRALIGAHKTQVEAWHMGKKIKAEQGSTGEQKAVLLSVMLATAVARSMWFGTPPIVLFDEVVAHLDVEKRQCLFDLIAQTAIQAWLTGTDASDFSGLAPHATMLKIDGGAAHQLRH